MDTMGGRLRHAMEAGGIKVDDLVAKKALSRAAVYLWLNDTVRRDKVRAETVTKLARVLNIEPDWLLDGVGPMRPLAASGSDDDHADVRAFSQAVGLSGGEEAQEYAEAHKLKFRADSLARKRLSPRHLAVMYGKGDSMLPRVRDGDAVLFDESDTRPRDGALFVVMVPGAAASAYSVKRCEIVGDLVLFRADNPSGDHAWTKPRRMDDPKSPITIIGRVRWIGSWEG